jgi:hypothetical protein
MNGTSVVSGAWLSPARLDPEWRVVAARDFTGDGRPDLQLRNQSTVSARIRQIVSLVMVYELPITPNSPWTLVASGALNADGYSDIVWQNVIATCGT